MKNVNYLKNISIAHRGMYNNKDIPENSMLAFKKALKHNYAIEFDIHILKDDNIVIFHDNNLKRMTGDSRKIENLTIDEVKKLNLLNTNEKIPLLKDVLKLVNGRVLIDIEIKNDHTNINKCKLITEQLDKYKGPFIIKSFHPKFIYWLKKHRNNYTRGLLINKKEKNLVNFFYSIFINSNFLRLLLKPDFYAYHKSYQNSKIVQKLRKKKIPILFWTIKNQPEENKYNDGIIWENY